jgi:hypothetical protein
VTRFSLYFGLASGLLDIAYVRFRNVDKSLETFLNLLGLPLDTLPPGAYLTPVGIAGLPPIPPRFLKRRVHRVRCRPDPARFLSANELCRLWQVKIRTVRDRLQNANRLKYAHEYFFPIDTVRKIEANIETMKRMRTAVKSKTKNQSRQSLEFLALALGKSSRTVRRYCEQGIIPKKHCSRTNGGHWRVNHGKDIVTAVKKAIKDFERKRQQSSNTSQ